MSPRLLLAVLLLATLPASAATLTGTVTDRTTAKPAAGDAVVLIGFGQGMQEVARTTTDAQGKYTLELPDAGTHLVRVTHQKATYFQPAPPSSHTVDVDVYDVRDHVPGIRTEADVLQVQTDPQGLKVVENYFVKNDSKPPLTQLSEHSYEVYLPSGARIDSSAAMGPAGMPVASSPVPLGDPNHYAFVFPVRPGETRFQISYHLPYSGSLKLEAREALATDNLVVMLPKGMSFTPSGPEFQPVPDNIAAQTFVRKGVPVNQPVSFTVAGSGSMPREQQGPPQAGDGGQGTPTAAQPGAATPDAPATSQATADNRPGGGLGAPIDTPDPLNKYKWWILSALALLLAVAAAVFLRRSPAPPAEAEQPAWKPQPATPPQGPEQRSSHAVERNLATSLKESLFALEGERFAGRISEEQYLELRNALDGVLRKVTAISSQAKLG